MSDTATGTHPQSETETVHLEPRERLLAAVCYVGPGSLVLALMHPEKSILRWHAAQGFVLFFAEALALALLGFFDATVGRIPWIGFVVMLVLNAGFILTFFVASLFGAVKAAVGEHVEIPIIEGYARKLPWAEGLDED